MLSKKTKYGLKALIYLARQDKSMPILISEISEKEGISKKFLESILLELKKIGVVGSKKGKGGGYYLLKPAIEITVASVIRLLDGPIAMLPCVSLNYYEKCDDCPSEDACTLNKLMIEVRDNTLKVLEGKSLYDLTLL
ncbi:RrF2 family transcriptional regulator [Flavobacterium sp. '19STA2R22 D10 B1']|uniref:RrF2 family transcriptional regulator n=1 Tax=Flavobacterium aerium TaxID=3037261 RepID=UPI00278C6826|nr:Rrf2 family transcriptional regulator [Flavobacterium sp. '19STA2R22 D10 B1']